MTSTLRSCLTFLALAGTVLLAGCMGPKDLAGLVVHIDGVRAFDDSNGQASVTVTARVHNETIRPIGIREMDLTLRLNGIPLGTHHSEKPLATQAMKSNTQDVTFVIENAADAARLKAALRTGALNYDLKTKLTVFSANNELRSNSTTTGSIEVNPYLLNLD
ncbi:LEA type 2 family protein [Actomonas aquatica]|uniref:Late embryogenesis abundant protein LEA-2 subgroup domain-containing protein n=1 Tax=Actomonas aquatica TaxID=2866162 RepID=A0ABZ1C6X8_9BACT|nr:LEA type 2 family protein [Opitutus sp. WL0086]WRQ87125.1 hypothetical protein K1X11_020120 [Opitutus sp. WL0086]